MPRALARGKAEAFKNLKLDPDFFNRMLRRNEAWAENHDFDVYLMEKSVMPVLLQGLDALSRHVDKKCDSEHASSNDKNVDFNPLVWLAQYLLRNHPSHVKDHRTPMYERFSELANIERGRRCLLRRNEEIELMWHEMVEENGCESLVLDDINTLLCRLDAKWYLDGALIEKMPKDFSTVKIERVSPVAHTTESTVCFADFWRWYETFVKSSDILRASAFTEAEKRQRETEAKAKKAKDDEARRVRAVREAMQQRSEREEQFDHITADLYINDAISRIMNKGATIDGVEEKEGGLPLRGEHIELIRDMLSIWGCPVEDDTNGDIWNDSALAAWQQWLKDRKSDTARGVDKHTLRRLIDKEEFEAYLQVAFPVAADDEEYDDYEHNVVEVRGIVESELDTFVEAVDEKTGELLQLAVPEHEVDMLRMRLSTSTGEPLLATADRLAGCIVEILPEK